MSGRRAGNEKQDSATKVQKWLNDQQENFKRQDSEYSTQSSVPETEGTYQSLGSLYNSKEVIPSEILNMRNRQMETHFMSDTEENKNNLSDVASTIPSSQLFNYVNDKELAAALANPNLAAQDAWNKNRPEPEDAISSDGSGVSEDMDEFLANEAAINNVFNYNAGDNHSVGSTSDESSMQRETLEQQLARLQEEQTRLTAEQVNLEQEARLNRGSLSSDVSSVGSVGTTSNEISIQGKILEQQLARVEAEQAGIKGEEVNLAQDLALSSSATSVSGSVGNTTDLEEDMQSVANHITVTPHAPEANWFDNPIAGLKRSLSDSSLSTSSDSSKKDHDVTPPASKRTDDQFKDTHFIG